MAWCKTTHYVEYCWQREIHLYFDEMIISWHAHGMIQNDSLCWVLLTKGDPPVFWRNDHKLACAWHDTKRLTMLSTVGNNTCSSVDIHSKTADSGMRKILRPSTVSNYVKYMACNKALSKAQEKQLQVFSISSNQCQRNTGVQSGLFACLNLKSFLIYIGHCASVQVERLLAGKECLFACLNLKSFLIYIGHCASVQVERILAGKECLFACLNLKSFLIYIGHCASVQVERLLAGKECLFACLNLKRFLIYIGHCASVQVERLLAGKECLFACLKVRSFLIYIGHCASVQVERHSFECFKQADVYTFGLILWELTNRCMSRGSERKRSHMFLQLKSICYISVKKFLLHIGHYASVQVERLLAGKECRNSNTSIPSSHVQEPLVCNLDSFTLFIQYQSSARRCIWVWSSFQN